MMQNGFAAAPVDDAIAHDAGISDALTVDQSLAAAAILRDGAADAGTAVVIARIAGREQEPTAADHQYHAASQFERS